MPSKLPAADLMRQQARLWREGADILKAGVKDSPSYDVKRLINERVEAIQVCAKELETLADEVSSAE